MNQIEELKCKIRKQVDRYNGDRHPSQCVGGEFLDWVFSKPYDEMQKLQRLGVKRANKARKWERYAETLD